jgi:hypothetical protein
MLGQSASFPDFVDPTTCMYLSSSHLVSPLQSRHPHRCFTTILAPAAWHIFSMRTSPQTRRGTLGIMRGRGGPDCVAAYIHWSDSPVPKLLRFVQNHIHHVFASAPSRRPGRLRGRTVLMATGGVVAGRRRQHRHQVEYGKPRGSPIDDSGPGG